MCTQACTEEFTVHKHNELLERWESSAISRPESEGDCPEDDLMVQCGKRGSDKRTDPEDPLNKQTTRNCKVRWHLDQASPGIEWDVIIEKEWDLYCYDSRSPDRPMLGLGCRWPRLRGSWRGWCWSRWWESWLDEPRTLQTRWEVGLVSEIFSNDGGVLSFSWF